MRHLAARGAEESPSKAILQVRNTLLRKPRLPVVTIVGKTWLLHVTRWLGVSPEENLAMIARPSLF